jgi:hypothetical protein
MTTRISAAFALGFLVCAASNGDAEEPKKPPAPECFRKVGEKELFGGKLRVKLEVKDGFGGYDVAELPQPGGGRVSIVPHPDNKIKADTPWFVLPMSVSSIWVFKGTDTLEHLQFSDDGTRITTWIITDDDKSREFVKTKLPKEVFAELPKALRDLVKQDK